MIRHIDTHQMKLDSKIAYLEKKTKEQLFGLNQSMKEAFAAERGECLDRMERRALRERIAIERQQVCIPTAWKFQDFSVIQILREISFGESLSYKPAGFAIFGGLTSVDLINLSLQSRSTKSAIFCNFRGSKIRFL